MSATDTIETYAFARAGLIGNPSDGYFGRTISVVVENFAARVTLIESEKLTLTPEPCDRTAFTDIGEMLRTIDRHGYYGGIRLVKAAIKQFHNYCTSAEITLPQRNFTLSYRSDIPVRVGLAGSSAIVTAVFRALMQFYEVAIDQPVLPGLILAAERDELGIAAGLQDRVIQVYEGAVYMDFKREIMQAQGYGNYEYIAPEKLPPLFVAYNQYLAEGTEVTHNNLRERYNRGEAALLVGIERWAQITQQARELIESGRGKEIGPLMDENFDLRTKLSHVSNGNKELVAVGRRCGAAVKLAGSGGAVIGTYDGDPDRLQRLRAAYGRIGATVIIPKISPPQRAALSV